MEQGKRLGLGLGIREEAGEAVQGRGDEEWGEGGQLGSGRDRRDILLGRWLLVDAGQGATLPPTSPLG